MLHLPGSGRLPLQVPFLFKHTIDALATPAAADASLALASTAAVPVALIGAYGCARAGAVIMSELRNAVFANVAQGAIRKVGGPVRLNMLQSTAQHRMYSTAYMDRAQAKSVGSRYTSALLLPLGSSRAHRGTWVAEM